MIKIGDIYYSAWVFEGKVEIDEHHVRVIRKGRAYLNQKVDGITWGKRSKKNGDFGWIGKTSRIFRSKFRIDIGPGRRFARSPSAAVRAALAYQREGQKKYPDDPELQAECLADIAALVARLKRLTSAKGRKPDRASASVRRPAGAPAAREVKK